MAIINKPGTGDNPVFKSLESEESRNETSI
jgi:hypothetical protein